MNHEVQGGQINVVLGFPIHQKMRAYAPQQKVIALEVRLSAQVYAQLASVPVDSLYDKFFKFSRRIKL